ncbi:MAG: hypothetical protein WC788_04415 [Candidatus Paceibacterota bacterium]|jgi:hypothetical protein
MKNFIKGNRFKINIVFCIFFVALFINFFNEETKAYGDCSQYGYAAYSDGSRYCKCMSGYVMDSLLGSPYCVSGLTYCYNKYGYNSTYNSLSDKCECNYGYEWGYDTFGNMSCIKEKSKDDICRENLGFNSSYNSYLNQCECSNGYVIDESIFGDKTCTSCSSIYGYGSAYDYLNNSCKCSSGYVWGIDSLGENQCVSGNQFCHDKYGYSSKYNSLTDKCECDTGYELTLKKIGDGLECKSCFSKYGLHSSYNSLIDKCECDNGYTLNNDNECVEKQNNVYFLLKEIDTTSKKAIVKSDYDYQNYLISYGIGCLSSSISRYKNNKIVINLGTDFDVDMFDKIVLYDDNETCDITSVKNVSSSYSLEPEEDIYIPYNLPSVEDIAPAISEGAIIRAENGIDVYIVKYIGSKKFKRLVLSPSVFNNYGHLKWDNLMVVSQASLNSFTTSELVRAVGDNNIYRLYPQGDSGQKRLLKDTSVLSKYGYDSDSIYEINSFDRESYITGAILE